LKPSKGVHLIFDLKKIPLPGAMVMSHPEDGRVAFVIPRPDYGAGVVLVGTTDGPTSDDPDEAEIIQEDVQYLMGLLAKYFPSLKLSTSDILSAYVGVRPLMGNADKPSDLSKPVGSQQFPGNADDSSVLQKVSREHHIDRGPGGTTIVAGGKYTTHRKMAEEIVDFALKTWKEDAKNQKASPLPAQIKRSNTRPSVSPQGTANAVLRCKNEAIQRGLVIPEELLSRYGAEALSILKLNHELDRGGSTKDLDFKDKDPAGFPCLRAQLRYAIRSEMVLHLEDFYLRRIPLYASRKDHGLPWAEILAQVWAEERGVSKEETQLELQRLQAEIQKRSAWTLSNS
jgi:glycerol-3-phosphate dehydrogenase